MLKSWLLIVFEQGLAFLSTDKESDGQAEAYDRFADIFWLPSLCVAKATAFITLNG